MHKRLLSALLPTVFAIGCSAGTIGDEPKPSPSPPDETTETPFAPAHDQLDATSEPVEPEDGDDPMLADAGTPGQGTADSGPVDSGSTTPPSADAGTTAPVVPPKPAGTCADPSSVKQLVDCITDRMPRQSSNRYTVPTAAVASAWRGVIRQMLTGSCAGIPIAAELAGMRVAPFRDSENGRTYCVLREVDDNNGDGYVDRGLGTFIVDPGAERELVHSAPHPFTDETTEKQAIAIFRETHSRAFLFTGVHRRASDTKSSCQSDYHVSDAAHEDTHLFHAATAELAAHYGAKPWTEIQWHGMAATTCPGVNAFMTHGVSTSPAADSQLVALRTAMRTAHPDWTVQVPGTADCSMGGTSNVQGRMLNQVAVGNVCGTSTKTSYGRFIHIEQQPGYRDASAWIAAVKTAFPAK